jgi:nucleotide-binding universal stress UspA family protein
MANDLKTIAVFVDATPEGSRRAGHAAELAHRWGAHLVGLHVLCPDHAEHPSFAFARGEKAIRSVILDRRADEDVAEAVGVLVGRRFAALCHTRDVDAEFRVICQDRADDDAILSSLHSDLVIVGHPAPCGLPGDLSPERLLLASGVPILIVPNAWKREAIGTNVLVGWNASREARRAVTDALPLLTAAQSVTVLVVDPDRGHQWHEEKPGADIALHVARHGAHARVEQVRSRALPIAEVILAHALDNGMDLIVIGAYSHARLAELLFGGATRTLLARMPIPILMSR